MVGQTFGKLTVTAKAPDRIYQRRLKTGTMSTSIEHLWFCKCVCGKTIKVSEPKLKNAKPNRSCGCVQQVKIKNGDEFGRLTIIGQELDRHYGKDNKRNEVYKVRCECGKEETRLKRELSKTTQCLSCAVSGNHNSNFKHGGTTGRRSNQSQTQEYRCWNSIKRRCNNPNSHEYYRYGGRGIKVCDRWAYSFNNFLEDVGPKPSLKHQIDRIDNDGNYTPENCHWTTDSIQRRNKSTTKLLTIGDKTMCITDWLSKAKVHKSTYYWRIRQGQTPEEALRLSLTLFGATKG